MTHQDLGATLGGPRYAFFDWNSAGQEPGDDELERVYFGVHFGGFYFGIVPSVGDTVMLMDSDPTCGSCESVVERVDSDFAVVRRRDSTFRYWADYEPATTTISGPDWLMRCFENMGHEWSPEDGS